MELDDLITLAHEHARLILLTKSDEQLMPMWLLINAYDEKILIATPFDESTNKDQVAILMQKMMKEKQIVAYSFLTEAWITKHDKGVDLDNVPLPSKSPDRQEVVLVIACDTTHTRSRSWEIKRDRRNRITALIQQELFNTSSIFGRFANLLQTEQ